MKKAVLINIKDDVVTLTQAAQPGDSVCYVAEGQGKTLIARDSIPAFHKMAIQDRKRGETLHKYAEAIGQASQDIVKGAHVDTHNLSSVRA